MTGLIWTGARGKREKKKPEPRYPCSLSDDDYQFILNATASTPAMALIMWPRDRLGTTVIASCVFFGVHTRAGPKLILPGIALLRKGARHGRDIGTGL